MSAPAGIRGQRLTSQAVRVDGVLNQLRQRGHNALDLLFDVSAVGIVLIDQNGNLVRVNEAMRGLLRQDCDLSPGRPVTAIFCDKRSPGVWEELAPVLKEGAVRRGYAAAVRGRPEGSVQAVEVTATPVKEQDGTISGAILQFIDLSAQTSLEMQLNQSQKLQAVGQLAGGIAHDFNNLLTVVLGAADEAIDRAQLDAETMEDLRHIRASAVRGAELVCQLLAFGRQQALQPRALAVNAAVCNVLDLLSRLLGSNVTLDLDLEQPGRTVRMDPTQLDQVLVNLAVNARDAMPKGGRLTLRTGQIDLFSPLVCETETIPPGNYVMVEVQDTGIGIPHDVLPRIFEPFFTTRRDQGGNGLGLATVHRIVHRSDGFLTVDSAIGKGTRVRIYLPRMDEVETLASVPPSSVVSRPSTSENAARTVLLIDDEDAVRRVAERGLARRGFRVVCAPGAEAALALLSDPALAASLHIVVSDLTMPGLDGAELIAAIRLLRPGLPAILVSGYADDLLRKRLAQADILFMPKPYATKELVAAIETRLDAATNVAPPDGVDAPSSTDAGASTAE